MLKKFAIVGVFLMFFATSFAFADDVYVTKRGKKFHKETCRLIKNKGAGSLPLDEAFEKGLTPCRRCFKKEEREELNKKMEELSSQEKDKEAEEEIEEEKSK